MADREKILPVHIHSSRKGNSSKITQKLKKIYENKPTFNKWKIIQLVFLNISNKKINENRTDIYNSLRINKLKWKLNISKEKCQYSNKTGFPVLIWISLT